jgi:hypothetical protein
VAKAPWDEAELLSAVRTFVLPKIEKDAPIRAWIVDDTGNRRCRPGTLSFYLTKLARLGGYLARSCDPPPGNVVIWRGLSRLTDIELGQEIGAMRYVGN